MPPTKRLEDAPSTLAFDAFWNWLQAHPNCIIRAGTPDAVLYDEEELHWHFAAEGTDTLLVQVLRGKKLLGEILVAPAEIAYVQGAAGEEDEYVFELITESEKDRVVTYHFVLSHGYDEKESAGAGRAVH
jgi:hypothetical protein